MRIAIIDSGVNINHTMFKSCLKVISKIHIYKEVDNYYTTDQVIDDTIGHGTSVCWIINKYVPNAEYIIVKIFENEEEIEEDTLLFALEYLCQNVACDIINISAGITRCSKKMELKKVCDNLASSGVILVAAFANDGAISYPAAFPNVIGVDISLSCFSPREFQFVENSPINIRGMGYPQLLPTVDHSYKEQRGASFVAPIITGLICHAMESGLSLQNVYAYLRENAIDIIKGTPIIKSKQLQIENAGLFPLNKETLALVEHADMLPFKIKHVYDLKYNGNIGKTLGDIVYRGCDLDASVKDLVVESINQVEWCDETDTMIIGHINMIGKALRNTQLKSSLLEKCWEFKKQVYLYDLVDCPSNIIKYLEQSDSRVRAPIVSEKIFSQNTFGKLHLLTTPVLGIFGTSPKQGKFTLQLRLRKYLSQAGYKIANLGTEPESELFQFEGVYPIGYNSTVSISGTQAVNCINSLMANIEEYSMPDLIIVGSQSQTIATGNGSLGFMAISQYELIMGSQPDAYILCVNTTDEMDYIGRTIQFLSSAVSAKVISLVVYPIIYKNEEGYLTNVMGKVSDAQMQIFLAKLEKTFAIHAYSLDDPELLQSLQTNIEVFFS